MKKIITNLAGEHPVSLDDFQHLQESYTEIIEALVKSSTNGNIVRLHGVAVTSPASDASCTAGAIYYNGEVFLVDAHSITGTGTLSWEIVETFAASNPIAFRDGTLNNVHVIRKLQMTYGAGEFLHGDLGDMPDYLFRSGGTVTGNLTTNGVLRTKDTLRVNGLKIAHGRTKRYTYSTTGDVNEINIAFHSSDRWDYNSNYTSHYVRLMVCGRNEYYSSGPLVYDGTIYLQFAVGNSPGQYSNTFAANGAGFTFSPTTLPADGGGNVNLRFTSSRDMEANATIVIETDAEVSVSATGNNIVVI